MSGTSLGEKLLIIAYKGPQSVMEVILSLIESRKEHSMETGSRGAGTNLE